ncbi:PAAR-like protein [Streptomyces sp. SAS_269]|uniref:PAAR-like protein n=1 Tax=Streptomyces sp. SAS_269 TaxID=3412749 RepID=UPI00403C629D
MPGSLLHTGAVVNCAHGAPTRTTTTNSRVLASGAALITVWDTTTVNGCPFQVPAGPGTKPQPCVRVTWSVPAARVLINGQPALIETSTGACQSAEGIPQGPVTVVATQQQAVAR